MPTGIQMSRQHPWRAANPDAVIVARPSRWGNPFTIAEYGLDLSLALFANTASAIWNPNTLGQDKTDEQFDAAYRAHNAWLKRIGGHPLEIMRYELAGHDLACWCGLDKRCHRDILLRLANPTSISKREA